VCGLSDKQERSAVVEWSASHSAKWASLAPEVEPAVLWGPAAANCLQASIVILLRCVSCTLHFPIDQLIIYMLVPLKEIMLVVHVSGI
jgi:hypothetical protein